MKGQLFRTAFLTFVRDIFIIGFAEYFLKHVPVIGHLISFLLGWALLIRGGMFVWQAYRAFTSTEAAVPHFYEGGPYEPWPALVIPEGLSDEQARALMLEWKTDKEKYESGVREDQAARAAQARADLRKNLGRAASIGQNIARWTHSHDSRPGRR